MSDDKPFRIVIHITRGTSAGRALGLMANGLTIAASTMQEAEAHLDHYLDCADAVLRGTSKLAFGIVAIINTCTGQVFKCETLMGKCS